LAYNVGTALGGGFDMARCGEGSTMQVRELNNEIVDLLAREPERAAAVAENPAVEVPKLVSDAANDIPAYRGDRWLYRIAVSVLGGLALIAALGSIGLVLAGKTTPEAVVALGSAAVGALVGLFATPPTAKSAG
jgi:hypothetical protein